MGLNTISRITLLGTAAVFMTGCAFSSGLSPAEEEVRADLTPSKYQPANREARNNITTQDNFAQAAFWSREYQINPSDLEAAVRLSAAVRKMGNPGKAVEIAQTSRALHPKDPYLTAEYSAALIASERAEEAIEALDDGLRVAPGYARLWSLKGAALDQLEKYDLARQHYSRALQITPRDPNIMSNLGLSYALAGDPATAETWLRRAAGQPGASANIQQTLEMVMQLQGKAPTQQAQAPTQGRPQARKQSQAQAQYQRPVQQATRQQTTRPSYFQSYEGRNAAQPQQAQTRSAQPQHNRQTYAARQDPQGYAPRTQQQPVNGTYQPRTSHNTSGRQTSGYAAASRPSYNPQTQAQQQGYQRQSPASQQTYGSQAPTQQKQAYRSQNQVPQPGAGYGGGYAVNSPQVQHRSNFTVMGGKPGGPKSAADAARAAAAQSKGQNRKVVVPADAPVSNDVQTDILSQIARNVGPQPSAEPVQLRRRYTPPPRSYAQSQDQVPNGYPQSGYPQQQPSAQQNQGYPQADQGTASRGAARRR